MCRIFYLNHPRRFASPAAAFCDASRSGEEKQSSGDVDIRAGLVNLALDFFLFHGYKPSLGERKLLVSVLNHDTQVVLALRKLTAF